MRGLSGRRRGPGSVLQGDSDVLRGEPLGVYAFECRLLIIRTLFAVCFAESMNLLTLVVFHALGILHWHTRQFNFSVSLYVLLAIILLIVPLVQCLLFTYRSRGMSIDSSYSIVWHR
jgi:hypothetical protein